MLNRILVYFLVLFAGLMPGLVLACACGCGVFDVQPGTMFPTGEGGTVWAEYDFMNQNVNWNGFSSASSANNSDKVIRTNFITLGGQYMFNRDWGVMAEIPYWDRYFSTTDDSGNIAGFNHDAIGDIRIKGIYSGFSPDMSSGLTFGLKLPNGDYSYTNFDRDTEIGTGSTDLLLGAYHMGALTADASWDWFVNGELDQPFLTTAGYRPGDQFDVAGGVYYDKWAIGNVKIAPVMQFIGSYRLSDRGVNADPENSGYKRILFAPGVEVSEGEWHLFTDVGLPVYQDMVGNQLTAPILFKLNISRDF